MKYYIGVDCGSTSIKFAIINENKKLIHGLYLKNRNIIKNIQKGFKMLKKQIGDIKISGVCTTGSGREFTSTLIGADMTNTEILAHMIGTLNFYPEAKTIFDIGGEDCKIITLNNGIWTNYVMNNICGAGTGAIIDSISKSLNVNIKDVGDIALKSKNKLSFPGKCVVLLKSAVVSRKNKGAENSDILMGVCRAIINNYLSLGKNVQLNPPYIFQGATAKNKALVKALEKELTNVVLVHEYCDLMGAIGSAILAMEVKKTKFKGMNIIVDSKFEIKNFICSECSNNCNITQIINKEKVLGNIGSRCAKY